LCLMDSLTQVLGHSKSGGQYFMNLLSWFYVDIYRQRRKLKSTLRKHYMISKRRKKIQTETNSPGSVYSERTDSKEIGWNKTGKS
jgi:hypothetical protein